MILLQKDAGVFSTSGTVGVRTTVSQTSLPSMNKR